MQDEYNRRAEAWVREKFPGHNPDPGTVTFYNDCAVYESGGWARVEVSWMETTHYGVVGLPGGWDRTTDVTRTLPDGEDTGMSYDWTRIIRELIEIQLPDASS